MHVTLSGIVNVRVGGITVLPNVLTQVDDQAFFELTPTQRVLFTVSVSTPSQALFEVSALSDGDGLLYDALTGKFTNAHPSIEIMTTPVE